MLPTGGVPAASARCSAPAGRHYSQVVRRRSGYGGSSLPRVIRSAALPVLSMLCAVPLASCSGSDPPPSATKPRIAATTPVLADVARNAVGDQADVQTIVPASVDPATYRPTSQQRDLLLSADIVVANGLGVEAGFGDALDEARRRGHVVIEVGPQLSPLPLTFADPSTGGPPTGTNPTGTNPAPSAPLDPHVWLDPDRMRRVTKLIADQASQLPRVDRGAITRASDDYGQKLDRADEAIQAALLPLSDAGRNLNVVTDRDVLGYFAERYGVTVVGVATSTNLDDLVTTMRETHTAVIVSTSAPASATATDLERRSSTVAAGSTTSGSTPGSSPGSTPGTRPVDGQVSVISIDVETLGAPGSGADTEIGLLTTLAHKLADALSH